VGASTIKLLKELDIAMLITVSSKTIDVVLLNYSLLLLLDRKVTGENG
jgi:hypothetical protein